MSNKIYPIGIQNFEKIRKDGYFYIDKTASGITHRRWGCIFLLTRLDWRVVILRYTDMFSTPIHRLTHLDWIVTK